jgi:hypothetical protein
MRSEVLVNAGLLQDGIRGVPRLDLSVYDKSALRDRAEPDLMVTFALPLEMAAVSEQEFLELRSEGRAHSGCQANLFLTVARQLEGDGIELASGEELIRLEKLGDHGPELLGESLDRRRFRGQSRHVVARRDPDLSFRVPVGLDTVDKASHRASRVPQT